MVDTGATQFGFLTGRSSILCWPSGILLRIGQRKRGQCVARSVAVTLRHAGSLLPNQPFCSPVTPMDVTRGYQGSTLSHLSAS